MIGDSFEYRGKNSRTDFGMKVVSSDVLYPEKRRETVHIIGVNGNHEIGDDTYDDRTVRIKCDWLRKDEDVPRHTMREIAEWLSEEGQLTLWNEVDKHYKANLYTTTEIISYAKECLLQFELEFICRPFAYGEFKSESLIVGKNRPKYNGTQKASTLIVIKNTGTTPINKVIITATSRLQ